MVKQLFKSKKAESWFKIMFSGLKSIFAGEVLGPLLFLVYINDIAKHLLSCRMFADDSSLFFLQHILLTLLVLLTMICSY